jgi:hypothetical protein
MMTDQPRRVTPAEISELLLEGRLLRPDAPLIDRITYQEHKAQLLSRIAAETGTTEAHDVAAQAWEQLAALARRLREKVDGGTD